MSTFSPLVVDPAFALAFRVRAPAPDAPTSLLVLLHGVGGDETNLAGLAEAVPADTLVVLPRGPVAISAGQFAWFRVAFAADGPRIVESEAERSRTVLVDFVAALQATHGIAPACTVIAGFSQGGILSASVGLSAPERVCGFAVLAGRILPELEPQLAPAGALARLHALIAHGRDDGKLPVSWAHRADAWLAQLGVPHDTRLYPGGHGIGTAMAADFHAWLRALLASPTATLHLDAGSTRIDGAAAGWLDTVIAPGFESLARDCFRAASSPSMALESAIAAIEDALAVVPATLREIPLASADPAIRAIAAAAGIDRNGTVLYRDAVEHTFARVVAVAEGQLEEASFSLQGEPRFVASLLLVRELMHHLDIRSIFLLASEPKEPFS